MNPSLTWGDVLRSETRFGWRRNGSRGSFLRYVLRRSSLPPARRPPPCRPSCCRQNATPSTSTYPRSAGISAVPRSRKLIDAVETGTSRHVPGSSINVRRPRNWRCRRSDEPLRVWQPQRFDVLADEQGVHHWPVAYRAASSCRPSARPIVFCSGSGDHRSRRCLGGLAGGHPSFSVLPGPVAPTRSHRQTTRPNAIPIHPHPGSRRNSGANAETPAPTEGLEVCRIRRRRPKTHGFCNGRLFTTALAAPACRTGLTITVCHLPPRTSKWNMINPRLFSQISMDLRCWPLTGREVIVNTIAATRTAGRAATPSHANTHRDHPLR